MARRHLTLIPLPDELRSPWLVLRPFRPTDADQIFAAVDESRPHLRPWMAWVDDRFSIDNSRDRCARCATHWFLRAELTVGIIAVGSGRYLGCVSLHDPTGTCARAGSGTGSGLLALVGRASPEVVVTASAVMAVDVSLVGTLILAMILVAAPARSSAAAGLSETTAELGGALVIAILGSIAAAVYRGALTDAIPATARPNVASAVRDTLGGAVVSASQLSDPLGVVFLVAAREAFVQGLHLIGIVSPVVMTGTAIVVAVVLGRGGAGARPKVLPADETTDEATAVRRVA